MTAAILAALSSLAASAWPYILGVLGVVGVWIMGRRTGAQGERAKAEQKDMRDANTIRRDGAQARDDARARDAGERLRDDDGWRRN